MSTTKTKTNAPAFAELPRNIAPTDPTFVSTLNDRVRRAQASGAQLANNLSDLPDAGAARGNLGLGSAATKAVGDLLQAANNLSDVLSASAARGNIGAVEKQVIANPLGAANATYSQTQMQQVITLLGQIVTALNT